MIKKSLINLLGGNLIIYLIHLETEFCSIWMYNHWWLVKLSVKSVVQRNFAYVREFKKYLVVAAFYSLWKFIVTIDRKLLYTFPLSFVHRAAISVYSFNFYRIKFEMLCSFSSVLKKFIIIVSVFGHHWGQACLENDFFSESYWIWGNVIDLVALKAWVIFDA